MVVVEGGFIVVDVEVVVVERVVGFHFDHVIKFTVLLVQCILYLYRDRSRSYSNTKKPIQMNKVFSGYLIEYEYRKFYLN